MSIAANGRNTFVILATLIAANRIGAAVIIEIARTESTYCAVNFWTLAKIVNDFCEQFNIRIPVAIHADHFVIKDLSKLKHDKVIIESLFPAGMTSVAIDASSQSDADNLKVNLALMPIVPDWAGVETEVGEIKGKFGLSTDEEALFLIQGLNAHGFFPDWIALNNGTTHGIEETDGGINVELTTSIHNALKPYGVSGAQHGTSGNNSDKLRDIVSQTMTTKANVATALQAIGWGVKVNDYGNAILGDDGKFIKVKGQGVSGSLWKEMVQTADEEGFAPGDYKKLNIIFQQAMTEEPLNIQKRIIGGIVDFVQPLMRDVFGMGGTGHIVMEEIVKSQSYYSRRDVRRIEDPLQWTSEMINKKALAIDPDKGPAGDYDD